MGVGVGRLPSGEVNNFSGTLQNPSTKPRDYWTNITEPEEIFIAGKENVAFPIKYLSVCKFWCYVSRLWCSDCWEGSAYYSHPWNLSQFSVKNVFRQWEIFPEVAVYTDACAYIDGKLLTYLCLTSSAPSAKTL